MTMTEGKEFGLAPNHQPVCQPRQCPSAAFGAFVKTSKDIASSMAAHPNTSVSVTLN
jgi:hypothetical protein